MKELRQEVQLLKDPKEEGTCNQSKCGGANDLRKVFHEFDSNCSSAISISSQL